MIAVGDTSKRADNDDSKDIGADMEVNLGSLIVWLESNSPKDSLNLHVLKGKDYARAPLFRAIDSLDVSPRDAVMFFYCGHGYYDKTGQIEPGRIGTLFRPTADQQRNLWLSEIRERIRTKHAAFFISVVDSCSVQPSRKRVAPAPAAPPPPDEFTPLFASLFFTTQGEIALNSSAPGEYAVSGWRGKGSGSLFTQAFLKQLRDSQRTTDWERAIKSIRTEVQIEFDQMKAQMGRDPQMLGGDVLQSQSRQTVWALKNDQAWFPF